MKIQFNNEIINLNFPKEVKIVLTQPSFPENDIKLIENQLNEIFKSSNWKSFLNNLSTKNILVIVNDSTRSTPTSWLLKHVMEIFNKYNLKIEFLIATGSHRNPLESELNEIFGKHFLLKEKVPIHVHSCHEKDALKYCGMSPTFQTKIFINSILFEEKYSGIITINSIEPHYFAGWTGGRKSIIPGCAGIDTITETHKHALSPDSKICKLNNNPVNEDFIECLDIVLKKLNKPIYSFQFVQDSKGIIAGLYGGSISSSFALGVQLASKLFLKKVPNRFDLIILVPYSPFDKTFYQSHKAIENSRLVLKNNSNIVLISSCNEGIGPDKFLEPFNSHKFKKRSMKEFQDNYQLGYHKAAKLIEMASWSNIWLYSQIGVIEPLINIVKPIFNIQNWINNFFKNNNQIKEVLIVLDAAIAVPFPKSEARSYQ